jgi:hypothetical protein
MGAPFYSSDSLYREPEPWKSSLASSIRSGRFAQRRAMIREKEHRLFLALLLNVSSRAELLRLVEVLYPARFRNRGLRWPVVAN